MTRYVGDANVINFQYESGTYATASGTGQWIGLVQESNVQIEPNVKMVRYVGGTDRNVEQFVDGQLDHTGTFSYHPQDWKFVMFALGSVLDAGSPSPYTHTLKESNTGDGNQFTSGTRDPFISFTIEDTKQGPSAGEHSMKTSNGCIVNSWEMSAGEGDIMECNVDYVAQNVTWSSGAPTAVTAATTRPFVWRDVLVHVPSGTVVNEVRNMSLSINNNVEPAHYLNGSRVSDVPVPGNREYEVSLGIDNTTSTAKTFYESYFIGGSEFNMMLEVTDTGAGAGSRNAFFVLSGCKMTAMDDPTSQEGVQNLDSTVKPTSCVLDVNDTIELYGAW